MNTTAILLIVAAYLLGSINSAIVICYLFRLPSPRTLGSGNPGTTNVLRAGGKLPAVLTLIFDVLKGVIFAVVARMLHQPTLIVALCGLAAVVGHILPVFFKFQGGKGVATTIGACLALNIWLGVYFLWIWIVMAALFRYSSLSALIATICMPIIGFFYFDHQVTIVLVVMALLVLVRHRDNIKRLIQGHESKIGQKDK